MDLLSQVLSRCAGFSAVANQANGAMRFAASCLILLLPPSSADAECVRYSVQVVGGLCSGPTLVFRVSENGLVAGYFSCALGDDFAFVWDGADVTVIDVPEPFDDGFGEAVNSSGQAVGWMTDQAGSPEHAFLAEYGKAVPLPPLRGSEQSWAGSINDAGVAVGYSGTGGNGRRAVKWVNGEVIDLQVPSKPSSVARDINDAGQICGWMGVFPTLPFSSNAFVWDEGMTTDLGSLPGGTAAASGLNNKGEVVGFGTFPGRGPQGIVARALYWFGGEMTIIEPLPGFVSSQAWDINNPSVIIGQCIDAGNNAAAIVIQDETMMLLQDLLMPESKVEIITITGINSSGQISGYGHDTEGDVVAILLTPVPPILGDFNCDWIVDGADLGELLGEWGSKASPADLNGDGNVDGADLGVLLGNWS